MNAKDETSILGIISNNILLDKEAIWIITNTKDKLISKKTGSRLEYI